MVYKDLVRWKYRRYMRNYLGTVKAVDESVGRMLKYLDDNGLAKNTIVIYSSDQGFSSTGTTGPRLSAECSRIIHLPALVRAGPNGLIRPVPAETVDRKYRLRPTFLEAAGLEDPKEVQGLSLLPLQGQQQQRNNRSTIPTTNSANTVYPGTLACARRAN